jgi:chloramphenicol-sensitive protein RarD
VQQTNYRKGIPFMLGCFFVWGFQPLYWYLLADMDTFFLMACRVFWAAAVSVALLWVQGKLPQLWAAFRDRNVLKREIPAALFLFGDWFVYLWAVQNGHVLESSLGYYIQPLVVFVLGAWIFKEKIHWYHFVALAFVIAGIVTSASGFGSFPYVTISLALMFAVYAAIKKSLTIDSVVSTTMEILMLAPLALIYILLFRRGENGIASVTLLRQIALIGAGIVTAVPMHLYAVGVRNLPLMTAGICQYISPTLSIFSGMIMGEFITRGKLVSFLFIWAGVIFYTANLIHSERKRLRAEAGMDKINE